MQISINLRLCSCFQFIREEKIIIIIIICTYAACTLQMDSCIKAVEWKFEVENKKNLVTYLSVIHTKHFFYRIYKAFEMNKKCLIL